METPATHFLRKVKRDHVLGMSLRGLIALVVILTVCAMSLYDLDVREPLYTLATVTVGYYFGQNSKQPPTTPP